MTDPVSEVVSPMPVGGSISLDDRKRIIEKINELIGDRPCEMCGNDNFALNESFVTPAFLSLGPTGWQRAPSIVHPSVLAVCVKCGNTKTFSLQYLGLEVEDGHLVG